MKKKRRQRQHLVYRDGPRPVDVHVGQRIRLARISNGMSQQKLGVQLGISWQQQQKYEIGVNRVSASRLWDIGRIFGVPISWFFDGADKPNAGPQEFHSERNVLELCRHFTTCPPKVRKGYLALVKATAEAGI